MISVDPTLAATVATATDKRVTPSETTPAPPPEPETAVTAEATEPLPETTRQTLGLAGDVAQASFLATQALAENDEADPEQSKASEAIINSTPNPLQASSANEEVPNTAILQAALSNPELLAAVQAVPVSGDTQAKGLPGSLTTLSPEILDKIDNLTTTLGSNFTVAAAREALGISVDDSAAPQQGNVLAIVDSFKRLPGDPPNAVTHGQYMVLTHLLNSNVASSTRLATYDMGGGVAGSVTTATFNQVLSDLKSNVTSGAIDPDIINISSGDELPLPEFENILQANGIDPKQLTGADWAYLFNSTSSPVLKEKAKTIETLSSIYASSPNTLINVSTGNNPDPAVGNSALLADGVVGVSASPALSLSNNDFATRYGTEVVVEGEVSFVTDSSGRLLALPTQERVRRERAGETFQEVLTTQGTSFGPPLLAALQLEAAGAKNIYDAAVISIGWSPEDQAGIRQFLAMPIAHRWLEAEIRQRGGNPADIYFNGQSGASAFVAAFGQTRESIGTNGFTPEQLTQFYQLGGNRDAFIASQLSPRAYLASLQQNQQAAAA
jgi:hypothetical protein